MDKIFLNSINENINKNLDNSLKLNHLLLKHKIEQEINKLEDIADIYKVGSTSQRHLSGQISGLKIALKIIGNLD